MNSQTKSQITVKTRGSVRGNDGIIYQMVDSRKKTIILLLINFL